MENGLSRVIDALPGLIWTMDANGGLRFVNNRWQEYTGQPSDILKATGLECVIHPDDRASYRDMFGSGADDRGSAETEIRLRRADGEYRWFVFRLAPVEHGQDLEPRWCGIASFADEMRSDGPQGNASEQRLRRFLNHVPVHAVFLNPEAQVEFVNDHAYAYYGQSFDDLSQWRSTDVIHPDDLKPGLERLRKMLSDGEPFSQQTRLMGRDGKYRWFDSIILPSRDAHGNIVRYVSIRTDIDELKKAEQLLTREVELLRMVAQARPLHEVLDALCRVVEEISPGSICSVLGVDIDRQCFRAGAGPSLPDSYNRLFDGKAIDPGYGPCSLAATRNASVVTSDPGSDSRWAGSSWPPLVESIGLRSCWSTPIASSGGAVIGVFALYKQAAEEPSALERQLVDRFINIASLVIERAEADAELHRTSEELQRTNRFLVDTQRLTLTASFTWDVERNEHIWSEENYRLFEFEEGSTVTLDGILQTIHPDDLGDVQTLLGRAADSEDFELAFRIVPASGRIKYAHVIGTRIEHITDRPVFMGAIQDVTARKLTEEALNRARSELAYMARVTALGTLTASIAHEVNQPLSGIITNASACLRLLAADPPDVEKAQMTAQRTIRDGNRASEVIKRLRAMFTNAPTAFEQVDLHNAVREVLALSAGEMRSSGVLLRTDLAAECASVRGDRVQLQQVVLNLILNAIDAMRAVNDRSRLLYVETRDEGQHICLSVRDAGTGLDDADIERLFDACYTTKAKGMGVGLAISRTIVENHGGRLSAAPNADHGATLTCYLPVINAAIEEEIMSETTQLKT